MEVERESQKTDSLLRHMLASAANSQGPGHGLPLTVNLIPESKKLPLQPFAAFPPPAWNGGTRCARRPSTIPLPWVCTHALTHLSPKQLPLHPINIDRKAPHQKRTASRPTLQPLQCGRCGTGAGLCRTTLRATSPFSQSCPLPLHLHPQATPRHMWNQISSFSSIL